MILVQEKEYLEKRERERIQNIKEIESKSQEYDNPNLDLDSQRTIFFKSESKHNPEYRKESSRFREEFRIKFDNVQVLITVPCS